MNKAQNETLTTLIKFASKQAEILFRAQGQLLPMYHAVTASGKNLVVPALDDDKDKAVALTKKLFVVQNVVFYVFMDEAWWLDVRADRVDISVMDAMRNGLSGHPDRREIVALFAEHRNGDFIVARRFILRPEVGKPTLSPLKIDRDLDDAEGRMTKLLQP